MTLMKRLTLVFRKRCEAIATELRAALDLRAFAPLPAIRLGEHLNAVLFTPQELPSLTPKQVSFLVTDNSWSAAVISQSPLWIVYHPYHTPDRQESDLMHEFAHVLLNHPLVEFDPITGLPQGRPRDEDEATYLGGCLQIPRRGLLWAVEQKMTFAQIGAHFGASKQMVRFRSNVTGIFVGDHCSE